MLLALAVAASPAAAAGPYAPRFAASRDAEPGEAALLEQLYERLRKLRGDTGGVANPKTLRFDEAGKPVEVKIDKALEGEAAEVILEHPTCEGWKRRIADAAATVVQRKLSARGITVASLLADGLLPDPPACPDPRLPGRYTLAVSKTGMGVFAVKARCTRHKKTVVATVNRKAEMQRCQANLKAIRAALQAFVKERQPPAAPDLVDLVSAGYLSSAACDCPLGGRYLIDAKVEQGRVKKITLKCGFCSGLK